MTMLIEMKKEFKKRLQENATNNKWYQPTTEIRYESRKNDIEVEKNGIKVNKGVSDKNLQAVEEDRLQEVIYCHV